jgi:hypothetical protein
MAPSATATTTRPASIACSTPRVSAEERSWRRWRACASICSRYVFEHGSAPTGEPVSGIAYRSRLGDELTNWAIFEGHQLDEIAEADAIIEADDPDLVAGLDARVHGLS